MHVQSMLWAFRADLLPELVGRLQCFAKKRDAIRKIEVGFSQVLRHNRPRCDGSQVTATQSRRVTAHGE
jgi:hypothetical protein